jgi:hypothetical protein
MRRVDMNDKELTFSEKEDIYYQIKNFKFRTEFYTTRENRLDEVASWAIWNPSDLNDTNIIEKPESIKILKPNLVFVLLNFAGNGDLGFEDPAWKSWKNFHSKSSMDKRLFNVLKHPKYEGAYMTDIIKCVKTKGEEELKKKVDNNEINMETQADIFIKEINIELFLMGTYTKDLYDTFMVNKLKNIKVTHIKHPAWRKPDNVFYEEIRNQLGINVNAQGHA